jgi:hypothetical protein
MKSHFKLAWQLRSNVSPPSPQKLVLHTDSSPFQSSPLETTTSPRLFWQNRNTNSENLYGGRAGSPSPTRRSSIERLQKASRVKNSNILALEQKHEYDPTRLPQVERPLAKVQGNAYNGTGSTGFRAGHQRSESKTQIPLYSPTKSSLPTTPTSATNPPRTPSKDQVSPMKSSLSTSKFKSSFDPENGTWSGDTSLDDRELPSGKSLHRHAKSVTFDAAPPQVNEYEMATPDLSSIGSNSREGSYESDDDDEDGQPYHLGEMGDHEDSFDASLEDTDKTPVVGPDDWRRQSADLHDPFEGSPMPDSGPSQAAFGRPQHNRTDSSNSDHRPLPPLPGAGLARSGSRSSPGLTAAAERMLGTHRSLPSPPPAASSKSEIQNIGNGKMSLEERLKLMMLSDDNSGKTAAEQQRERRLRRAGTRDRLESHTPEAEPKTPTGFLESQEEDDTIGDLSGLEEYQLPPRISRESILRRVNGNKVFERESDYHFSSPAPSSSPERRLPLDPDVPIPSTEDSMLDVDDEDDDDAGSVIRHDLGDRDGDFDSITDLYNHDERFDEHDDNDDDASHYSDQEQQRRASDDKGQGEAATPRATTPVQTTLQSNELPNLNTSLPEVETSGGDDELSGSLQSYMVSKSDEADLLADLPAPKMAAAQAFLQRPYTPEQPMSKPEYDGTGWGTPEDEYEEPGTPDSVIHHPMPEDEEIRDSPAIPEQFATIKSASGSKLKTRASATPSDIMAMRDARRQVSREIPNIPPIPERHRDRLARDFDPQTSTDSSDEFLERHPSFKKRSLTLDLDLGLSLDQDFERVIEAQKVEYTSLHILDIHFMMRTCTSFEYSRYK